MKSYNEIAYNVLQKRDAHERKKQLRQAKLRRTASVLSVIAVVITALMLAGMGYVFAAGMGLVDDYFGIFSDRIGSGLSQAQQEYLRENTAQLGESVTCNGYTVTAKSAFTDGTVALVLLDIEAPEGVNIADREICFETGAKEIIRGENPEKYLNITGLSISDIPVEDHDGKSNTRSMMIQISCVRLNGSTFSFADGYERILLLEDMGDYMNEYPYSRYTVAEGVWAFRITFQAANTDSMELLSMPLVYETQGSASQKPALVSLSSVRLHGLSLTVDYTVISDTVSRSVDLGDISLVMKNGDVIYAYPKTGSSSSGGTLRLSYICQAPIAYEDLDHIIIGNVKVFSNP